MVDWMDLVLTFLVALIALRAAFDICRRNDDANLDVLLLFGSLTLGMGLWALIPYAGPLTQVAQVLAIVAILTFPLALLRLVRVFKTISVWPWIIVFVGNGFALLVVAAEAGAPVPGFLASASSVITIGYIGVVVAYSASVFLADAILRRGLARKRLLFAAAGSILLTLAALAAIASFRFPIVGMVGEIIAIVAIVAYAVAFATPRMLEDSWLALEIRDFLQRLEMTPYHDLHQRARDVQHLLMQSAFYVIGKVDSVVCTMDEEHRPAGNKAEVIPWKAMTPEQRLASSVVGAKLLALVPIRSAQQYHGVMVIHLASRPLFLAQSLSALESMARQAASALEVAATSRREREALRQRHEAARSAMQQENRNLVEANRMKSRFLANMSHELRTPMNSIVGFSELLSSGRLGTMDDQAKDAVEDIHRSAVHLHDLIDDTLDLAKVEAGRLSFVTRTVQIATIAEEVLGAMRPSIDKKGIRADVDVERGAGRIRADPTRLRQIFYNFVSNAVRHAPQNGHVTVRTRGIDDGVRIEVEDDGPGIPLTDQHRLFQPFEQLDTSRNAGGTGLGLALVRQLVEAQGGRVGVDSQPGKGAMFWAEVPCRWSKEGAAPAVPDSIPGRESLPGADAEWNASMIRRDPSMRAAVVP